MRRKYITSHYPLPITICILIFSTISFSKEPPNETNIVCFAAKNKWVCAPENKQEVANEKANKLLKSKHSELGTSDIVIKSINIPKFDSPTTTNTQPSTPNIVVDNKTIPKIESNTNKKQSSPITTQTIENKNPYAKLWSHQLIGVSTPQNAINFVRNHNLNKDDILIIQSVRNGMDWWIILFGLYQDKKTGLDNENNLPDNINKPWLRPLKNLQVNGFIEKF